MENGYVLQISGSLTLYSMTNYTEQTWTNSGIERMIVFFYCSVPGFQLFCLGLHWVWVALEPHALSKRENGTQLKELGVEESMVYLTNSEVFLHLLNYQPQWSMVHHAACFNSPEESECSYKFLVAVQSTATSLAFSETGSKSIQPPKQSKHGCMHMYIYILHLVFQHHGCCVPIAQATLPTIAPARWACGHARATAPGPQWPWGTQPLAIEQAKNCLGRSSMASCVKLVIHWLFVDERS